MRSHRAVLSLIAAVAAAGAFGAAPAAAAVHGTARFVRSPYFAGYVATPKSGGATAYKYVTATFTLPALNCAVTPGAEVYHFVGTGGWSTTDLQAVGVDEGCNGTTPFYEGVYWNGISPGPSSVLSVSPGDTIVGSINHPKSLGDQAIFKLFDHTTGHYFQQTLNCSYYCATSSAEVLTQGNLHNNGTADFGSVNFNAIKVSDSAQGHSYPLNNTAFRVVKTVEYGPVTGLVDVQPGAVTSTTIQSAFTNTWLRQN